jgi:hypothetical protein
MGSSVQSQGAVSAPVFELARSAVAERASPPRAVRRLPYVVNAYRGAMRPLALLLAFVVFDLVAISLDRRLSSGELTGFLLFLGAGGLFFLLFPAYAGLRSASWARSGLVASADVIDAASSIRRRKQPVVVGRRVVHHPGLGDYEDAFSIGDAWRESVRVGARLEVLVSPSSRRTWITLGMEHAPAPTRELTPTRAP